MASAQPSVGLAAGASLPPHLTGTERLEGPADLAPTTLAQWNRFLLEKTTSTATERAHFWHRNLSNANAYNESIRANRERLARAIGVVDARVSPTRLVLIASANAAGPLTETSGYAIWEARWPVLNGVNGEGLLLRPKGRIKGFVIALPDPDVAPEVWAGLGNDQRANSTSPILRSLAEAGIQVLIPSLTSRTSVHSGDSKLKIYTNQPHREWIYRQAAEVGRHIIGYEVQKVLAAIDWFATEGKTSSVSTEPNRTIGLIGYGEGGLIALHSAALDPRISVTWIGGHFQSRNNLWTEPLYRNVWGLLSEFGDAEVASMIAPRSLVIEHCRSPEVAPPKPGNGPAYARSASAGALSQIKAAAVRSEWARAITLVGAEFARSFKLVCPNDEAIGDFGSRNARDAFFTTIGAPATSESAPPDSPPANQPADLAAQRERRTVEELQGHVQSLVERGDQARDEFFWAKLPISSADAWRTQITSLRTTFAEEFIGRIRDPKAPLRPKTRLLPAQSSGDWSTYELALDVYPGVQTWGWLLLPTHLSPGERRPVVVCQHGANSLPADLLANEKSDPRAYNIYGSYAAKLASRGFVVFAPYMPSSKGEDEFRQLQRKANPLRLSLFSTVIACHEQIIAWLKQQPFVDGRRIGFYGMSYGGKAALRVGAALEDYAAIVCSGDFNDYPRKMTSPRFDKASAMFNANPDMVEFDLANRFSHAEMAALIAPRAFMVEHGYRDRVAPTEWMAAEYAKVQRLYFRLGIPERTGTALFDGPHTVHGTDSFAFLHRMLEWPAPR